MCNKDRVSTLAQIGSGRGKMNPARGRCYRYGGAKRLAPENHGLEEKEVLLIYWLTVTSRAKVHSDGDAGD